MKNSLRGKIFGWLLVFVISFTLMCTLIIFFASKRISRINNWANLVRTLNEEVIEQKNCQSDFIRIEVINAKYFTTGESPFLNQNNALFIHIKNNLSLLKEPRYKWLNDDSSLHTINQLEQLMDVNYTLFDSISSLVYIRGFKDWGYEGKMRDCIHQLEKIPELNTIDILQLRRREKDFIIRIEQCYVDSVHSISLKIKKQINTNKHINNARRKELNILLDCYLEYFTKLSEIEIKTGIKNMSGMTLSLQDNSYKTKQHLKRLLVHSVETQASFYNQVIMVFLACICLFIILSMFISYHISKKITRPLNQLSTHIDEYTNSGFTSFCSLSLYHATADVKKLMTNFMKMQEEIDNYFNLFKKKVEERTREIEEQKNIIMAQNSNIIDSINSAKMIQRSLLQDDNYLKQIAPTCFVLYIPKDIVSGDFYHVDWKWCDITNSEVLCLFAGDATGHGVPGAFMSLLGLSLIKSIFDRNLPAVEFIITLNNLMYHHLHKKKKRSSLENFENIEAAYCCINYNLMKLQFIGANRPCYIVREGTLIELKRSIMAIGEDMDIGEKIQLREFDLQEGDCVYIFSDGYASQFSGTDSKKMNSKRLGELLQSVSIHEPVLQKHFIEQFLRNWKGQTEQTDDILVLGLKITRQGFVQKLSFQ